MRLSCPPLSVTPLSGVVSIRFEFEGDDRQPVRDFHRRKLPCGEVRSLECCIGLDDNDGLRQSMIKVSPCDPFAWMLP